MDVWRAVLNQEDMIVYARRAARHNALLFRIRMAERGLSLPEPVERLALTEIERLAEKWR